MAPKHASGKEAATASKVVEATSTVAAPTAERAIAGKSSPLFLSFSEISISRDFTSLRRTPVNLGSHPYTYSGSSRPSGELREFAILERAKGVAPLGKPREFTLGGLSPLVKLGRFASRGEARGLSPLAKLESCLSWRS